MGRRARHPTQTMTTNIPATACHTNEFPGGEARWRVLKMAAPGERASAFIAPTARARRNTPPLIMSGQMSLTGRATNRTNPKAQTSRLRVLSLLPPWGRR